MKKIILSILVLAFAASVPSFALKTIVNKESSRIVPSRSVFGLDYNYDEKYIEENYGLPFKKDFNLEVNAKVSVPGETEEISSDSAVSESDIAEIADDTVNDITDDIFDSDTLVESDAVEYANDNIRPEIIGTVFGVKNVPEHSYISEDGRNSVSIINNKYIREAVDYAIKDTSLLLRD